ncbi:MAG TPA: FAD-dependent oxidoreductase [Caulobacteraceae bacterium]|nr:FAD-dependent oxidoreductase [Caulobacteraceae bacterium]
MDETWDAIVIGSGMGGLAAAGFLARAGGWKVLVLEQHSERGGQTHTFRRDGASWDVGLHYIGGMHKGAFGRDLFDFLSGGALEWNRMPDDFERFVYPEFTFAVPSDPKRYAARLIARFPDEAGAIRRYFRDISAAARWLTGGIQQQMTPPPVAAIMGVLRAFGRARATQTTGAYLEHHFHSPQLKALLASQWGDYGLPPSRSAFAIHATVIASYLNGAWFPVGGAGRIARTIEAGVEAAGGAIRVCQEVTAVVIEDGRAVGVDARDRRGPEPVTVRYRAPLVISDAGAALTYGRLLPTDGEIGLRTAAQRGAIDALRGGMSAVNLYLRLKAPVSTLGVQGENYWINTTLDHDDLETDTARTLAGEPRHAYLSFPSAKSGDDRFHTAEIIAGVSPEAFSVWRGTVSGDRGPDYAKLKQRVTEGLLRLADRALPGFSDLVTYAELSTPLTIEHFVSHPDGRFYALPGLPERYRSSAIGVRTPIQGLLLTGSDAACLGVTGALIGGLAAAGQALGPAGFPRIMAKVKSGANAAAATALTSSTDKQRAVIVGKTALTPSIWRLELELDAPLRFVPGQFVKVRVAPYEWRDYSIAAASGRRLTLLISNRTHGDGSNWADAAQPGEATQIEGPFGTYRLEQNGRRRLFVATGCGIAPFLPMFEAMAAAGELGSAELYFGCRSPDEDITAAFSCRPKRTVVCASRASPTAGGFAGRVTQALAARACDLAQSDIYLCGSAAMVADCRALFERGDQPPHILTEPY